MELIGAQLDKYRVVERITQGSMADIYKAYQPDLDRHVAIKVLATDLAQDVEFLKQFEREARLLARLAHPNILPIYDSGTTADGRPYLVMQYHTGGTLADCSGRALPLWQVVDIVSQVGDALAYAHAHGVVHRDVKPSNILLAESGRPLLADFGLAMILNAPGEAAGTRGYVAPEQRDGKPVDGRADIFSLGVILYELLTGARFGTQNYLTRSVTISHVPTPIALVIASSANWKIQNRYETAEDFVVALQAAANKQAQPLSAALSPSQAALEIALIVVLILTGAGLIVYGMTLSGMNDRAVASGLGLACLLISALTALRDRARPLTMKFLNAITLILWGLVILVFGLASIFFPVNLSPFSQVTVDSGITPMYVVIAAVGAVFVALGGRLYLRERRSQAAVPQVSKRLQPASRQYKPQEIRQMRNAIINTLIMLVAAGGLVELVSQLTPKDSWLHGLDSIILPGFVVSGVLLGLGLAIWYVYVTFTSAVSLDDLPQTIPGRVKVRQARLAKAHQYEVRLRQQITQIRDGAWQGRLARTMIQLGEYVAYLEQLTDRLDRLDHDPLLQRDRSTVPRAIDRLEWQLTLEDDNEDERVKDSARQTLAARQLQLDYLSRLEAIMQQTDLYCEQAVAELGTLYSQVLLIDAKDIDGARARHVQADIDRQVTTLRDAASSLDQIERDRGVALA